MNSTFEKRHWFTVLMAFLSLLMGFCEYYTWCIGWHPGSSPWNRAELLHLADVPFVLLAAVVTFGALHLFLKTAGKLPLLSPRQEILGRATDAPFAFLVAFLLLCWMPFFLVFYPGTGMNDTTDIMRAGIWATGQHTFIYCMFIYGLTQLSQMFFDTTSYGLAVASLIQMVLGEF